MVPAVVVPEAECGTEVFNCFQTVGREVPVEGIHLLLEGLVPSFDVIPLVPAKHDMAEPEPSGRPKVPGATVGGDGRLALTVPETSSEEA